jgi:hypothetical protein
MIGAEVNVYGADRLNPCKLTLMLKSGWTPSPEPCQFDIYLTFVARGKMT